LNVSIHERHFTNAVEYVIETPKATLAAHKKIFSLLPHITLQSADDSVVATITGESFIRTKFTIDVAGLGIYEYHTEKLWKGVDICEGEDGPFHLYAHKGLRYSIFQGDTQIAAFSGNSLIIGDGRNFDLRVDADANLPLIISMVLCLNTQDGDDRTGNGVTFDFGRLGPQDRRFDEAWRPNDERVV
jgi:hypothetical protein